MRTRSRSLSLSPRLVVGVTAMVLIGGLVGSPVSAAVARPARTPANSAHTRRSDRRALTGLVRVGAAPRVASTTTKLGAVAAATAVSGDVALRPRDPAALAAAATAVSTPTSRQYRHYLRAGQFRAAFGPTNATIGAVESTLRAAHLRVSAVSGNGMLISFSGTAAQADTAFHSSLASFRLKGGRVGVQLTSAPEFPAAIAGQVTSVIGLSTLAEPVTGIEHWTKKGAGNEVSVARSAKVTHVAGAPAPCQAATANAIAENGLTYDQLAHSYGLDGLFNAGDLGGGQHIAVYELFPYVASDVSTFDSCYFGAAGARAMGARLHSVLVDGSASSGVGAGSDEADLDVEDVSAFAPKADIDVYTGPPTNAGYLDTYNTIVTQDTDQFVTSSYGSNACEQDTLALEPGLVDAENQVFEQAALQGQTVLNSSGDSGSDSCAFNGSTSPVAPKISAADPASQPFVVSVGGTAVLNDANRPTEQVWNDGNFGGSGGGGTSALWSAPSWQQAAIASVKPSVFAAAYGAGSSFGDGDDQPCPQATATDDTVCRAVPDVSAEADEYNGAPGIFDATFGGWVDFGGTSSSAPLWAAMLADVQASAGCQASGPLGFVSPKLYAIGANPTQDAASFNDVTLGNDDMYAINGGASFSATAGYDLASGLGSPRLTSPNGRPALAAYLCAAPISAPAVSGLSPSVEPLAPTGTLKISGTNFTGTTSVSIGGYRVPTADVTVAGSTEIDITPPPSASATGGESGRSGAGPAIVSVTGPGGTSAAIGSASRLEYVDTAASSTIPSVTFISGDVGGQPGSNTVTVYGSGYEQGGTSDVTSVTVGGLAASSFTVDSADRLTVTVPAYQNGTTACASVDSHAATELCQTQVVVTGPHGSSSTSPIVPLYEGSTDGSTPCAGCASLPARTEYDYLPAPTITSLSSTYLSEQGFTVESIIGQGFATPGYDWTQIGPLSSALGENFFALSVTPDEIDVVINPTNHNTVVSLPRRLRVVTDAGSSAAQPVIYAGVPKLTALRPAAGPATGGGHLTVTGEGLSAAAPSAGGYIEYINEQIGIPRDQLSGFTVSGDTSLTATTPQVVAGAALVTVCTVSGCSFPNNQAQITSSSFTFYQPGNPVVTAVTPGHGPASGGNSIVITGKNLGSPLSVRFGKRPGVLASDDDGPAQLSNAHEIVVQAPPHRAGTVVHITVTTTESKYAPGGKASPATATTIYRYVTSPPSAPRHLKTSEFKDSIKVSWARPLVNGGATITGYRITITPVNLFSRKQPKPSRFTVGPHVRSDVLQLHPDVYVVTVVALNKHGAGAPASVIYPKSLGVQSSGGGGILF